MPNKKPPSIIPWDDEKRLAKLHGYEILDTHSEEEFDQIAQLAADFFDCREALITFVDTDTVFFKSNLSTLNENKVPRKDSLCSLTILDNKVTVIEDASQFDDLMESPYVCKPGGIRFYAGAPLITSEGLKLGSICVFDNKPRTATPRQVKMLADLAKIVIDKLENRALTKRMVAIQTEYVSRSVHDMKNYIGNLLLATEMLQDAIVDEKMKDLPKIINQNANRLSERMNEMLNLSKIESSAYNLTLQKCNIAGILNDVISNYSTMSNNKNQVIVKKYAPVIFVIADCKTMTEIFENLLSNAIKYSFPSSEISITSEENEENTIVGFHDNGQGLSEEDLGKIFTRYAKISSMPTGKESSTGLGLTITKILVELHDGDIWVESMGKDKGASFYVSLPKKTALEN